MQESDKLAGCVALVTGGGRGIGRAVALAFAREGAAVAVAARTAPEIEEVAAECRAYGAEAIALQLDASDRHSCDRTVRACEEALGKIDVLVNNAGTAASQKFTEVEDSAWQYIMDLDLNGPFYLTRAGLPGMLRRGQGAVIAIASIAGKIGGPYITPYATAKAGLIGMMRSLSAEYARSGVTFNSVCPAYVDTPMTEHTIKTIMEKTGRTRDETLRVLFTPQGRLVQPEEVAAVCVLLASPEGRSINGQAINVDGGQVPW
jgi:NAD(P)-dependent dehydrogenase (short-subunit alcohol dehydrogenase family)